MFVAGSTPVSICATARAARGFPVALAEMPRPGGGATAAAARLIAALQDSSRYPHPCAAIQLIETHLSWVLLTGAFAYKIKKPVDLGFVDFTTLDRRRHYCEEEIRLNRRLALRVYLDVVAITGHPGTPRIEGTGPAIEYAVRMVQFPQEQMAARQLAGNRLGDRHIDTLARDLAAFHDRIPWAGAGSGHGDADRVHAPVRQNFSQLRELLPGSGGRRIEALARWRAGARRGSRSCAMCSGAASRPAMSANATATCTWAIWCCWTTGW